MIGTLLVTFALLGQVVAPVESKRSQGITMPEPPCHTWFPQVLDVPNGGEVDEERAVRFLSVAVVDEATRKVGEPLLGTYRRQGSLLVFTPRFPFVSGRTYRVRTLDAQGQQHERDYTHHGIPGMGGGPRFAVDKIYPTADVVPANLLKFYIHFNFPVREGPAIFDHIRLLNEQGESISAPWMMTELWNQDATRLTLRIHPGRVKQGVNLRENEGPVLEPGKKYTLLISGELWSHKRGPLGNDFKKSFHVVAEDHSMPRLDGWQLGVPLAKTTAPLMITFLEPLDVHLAKRCITVIDSRRKAVDGDVTVTDDGLKWQFNPAQPWKSGEYSLVVDDILEDLAGNTPSKPFEVDLQAPASEPPPLTLRFRPVEPVR